MSNRCSIYRGDTLHFYREIGDSNHAYLQSQCDKLVAIPVTVWEAIRNYQVVDLEFVDYTDERLRVFARSNAFSARRRYLTCKNEFMRGIYENDQFIYGDFEKSTDDELAKTAYKYFFNLREG